MIVGGVAGAILALTLTQKLNWKMSTCKLAEQKKLVIMICSSLLVIRFRFNLRGSLDNNDTSYHLSIFINRVEQRLQ